MQEPRQLAHANGTHRFESRCHAAAAGDPVLVWLPALGVAARHYDAFGAALAALGVGVLVPDARGMASSSLRASRRVRWDYQDVIEDAAVVLEAAAARARGPVWLGGHSIGGQFATLLAARRPDPVRGLALVATGIPHWRHYGARAAGMLLFAAWVRAASAVSGYYPGRRLGFAGNESATLMREWTRTIATGRYTLRGAGQGPALARLARPVLSVALQRDWMIPPGSTRALVAMTAARDVHSVRLGDADFGSARADHFGWLREPAPVARCVAGFIASRAAAGGAPG